MITKMDNKIGFKTISKYFDDEKSGLKPFTIREFEEGDVRFDLLDKFIAGEIDNLDIMIIEPDSLERFTRQIKYADYWRDSNNKIFALISWRA